MTEEIVLKDTLNAHWKQNKSNFGFRMLQKMGWSEEKGLGKNEDGITKYVKIDKRDEGLGLGMDKLQDDMVGSKAWGATIQSYNSVLEVLKATYKTNNNSSTTTSSDNDDDSSSSDESDRQKKKKSKKNEGASTTEIKTVGIKYKKFRDSKIISNRSIEDKRAIFGHSSAFSTLKSLSSPSSSASLQALGEEKKKEEEPEEKKKSKKEKKEKKEKREESSSSPVADEEVDEKKEKKEKKSKNKKRKREEDESN